MASRLVAVPGARLEVFAWGSGEPVVFIPTALIADELRPLATDPALDGYHRVVYHRRGYANSSLVQGPGSIARDAADCAALLDQLQIDSAHVVGLSFSGAIALQLASDRPQLVASLTLIEPPPVHTPSAAEFRAANDRLVVSRQQHGPQAALDEFLTMLIGPDWHQVTEAQLPGSSAQMRQDTRTFFDVDLGWPAPPRWQVGSERLRLITVTVRSGPTGHGIRRLAAAVIPTSSNTAVAAARPMLNAPPCDSPPSPSPVMVYRRHTWGG